MSEGLGTVGVYPLVPEGIVEISLLSGTSRSGQRWRFAISSLSREGNAGANRHAGDSSTVLRAFTPPL